MELKGSFYSKIKKNSGFREGTFLNADTFYERQRSSSVVKSPSHFHAQKE